MGEIGIPHREYLYVINFWQARRIIRGYRKRDRLKHQLMAECVYAALYAMRDPKGKTVSDMFPQLFENDDTDTCDELADEDIEALRREMLEWNERHANANL